MIMIRIKECKGFYLRSPLYFQYRGFALLTQRLPLRL